MTIEEKRYKDLQDYFSDKDCAKTILENDDEFKKWLERLKWHVRKCDELAMELQAHREAWKKILDEMMDVSIPGQDAEYVYQNIYDIIRKYRPKEADAITL